MTRHLGLLPDKPVSDGTTIALVPFGSDMN
jgi:hypothetical protein